MSENLSASDPSDDAPLLFGIMFACTNISVVNCSTSFCILPTEALRLDTFVSPYVCGV